MSVSRRRDQFWRDYCCLPWQSPPSCCQYRASASAEAPRPASRGCLSCSSWREEGLVRRQPAAPPQELLEREPEPEPAPGRAVAAADAAVGHAGHVARAVGDVVAAAAAVVVVVAAAAAGKGVARLEEDPWEQPEQPVVAAAVPTGKPSHAEGHAEGRAEGRAEVHAGARVEGAAAHAEERVEEHEEGHAEGRAGAHGRESAGVDVGGHAAARAEQRGPEGGSPEPDVCAVRTAPAPKSGPAVVGVVELGPAAHEPGPAARRGAPAAHAAAAGAGVVAASAAVAVWGMLDNPQAARAESCLVVAAAVAAAAAAAAEQRHTAVDCTSRHG